jgi:hypothetical protein
MVMMKAGWTTKKPTLAKKHKATGEDMRLYR